MAFAMRMGVGRKKDKKAQDEADRGDVGAAKLEVALREIYNKVDTENSGVLDKSQIGLLMEEAGAELEPHEVDEVFATVDQDGGGDVDFAEFAAWMMSTSDIASKLRRGLNSKVLGGLALDDFINEDELKASERSAHISWAETPRMWLSPDNDQKQTLFVILDEPGSGKIATLLSAFIQTLIFISSGVFICETLEVLKDGSDESKNIKDTMHLVEGTCVIIFTIEYIIRMSVCTHRPARNKGFWSYFFEFMNLIDFFAVAPWYVELAFNAEGGGFAVLRILRLARIFRIVKVGTFKENLDLVIESLRRSKAGLLLLVYLVLIFMVIMSSILYMVEEEEEETAFTDIPTTFWCTIVTMTSVGYGDMYPTSDFGRFVGSFIMLSGILTLAVPITLIGNNFQDVWVAAKKKKEKDRMIQQMAAGAHGKDSPSGEEGDDRSVGTLEISTRLQTAIIMLDQSYAVTQNDSFKAARELLQAAEDGFAADRQTRDEARE